MKRNDERGLPHVPCPECAKAERVGFAESWIFQDSRGGYECTICDQRYVINQTPVSGYGGPLGPLRWYELPSFQGLVCDLLYFVCFGMGAAAHWLWSLP